MSDAKLTADIVIKFNKQSLQFFNELVKTSETSLRKFDTVVSSVFTNLGKVNKKAMESATDAGKAQVKLEKAVAQSSEIVANSEKRIARATLETSKALIQNSRIQTKASKDRVANEKLVKEASKAKIKTSKAETDQTKKEAAEDRKLAARLKRVSREKAKLNRETTKGTKESKKRGSQATKTSKVFGEMATKVAQLRVILGLAKFAANLFIKAFTIPAGVLTGWLTFLGMSARGEREMSKMAKSVQVSVKFLKAFSMATKDAGLSADNAVDMLEEMSNKIGDGLETPTHGTAMAFKELGLNLKEVQKMSRQKGLTTIMDSLVKFRKKTGSDQKTVRLGDELFGGEGNKFVGYLLESGEIFSEIIEKNKEFDAVSEKTSNRMDGFYKTLERTGKILSGLKNEGLSEEFAVWEEVFKRLQKYLLDNKDSIIKEIKSLGKTITDVAGKIFKIFTNKDNVKTFNSALRMTVRIVDKLANGLERSLDAVTLIRQGEMKKALTKVTGVGEEKDGFLDTTFKLAKFSNPTTALSQLMQSMTSPTTSGIPQNNSTDNSKKDITVQQTFQLSGENQNQVAEEAAGMIIDTTENY
jgi:hypothetical protein